MPKLELYGTASCQYTSELREWLEWKGSDFTEYDVDRDIEARDRMRQLAQRMWKIKMHELSIAMSIVEMAQEEAERHGAGQVQAVHLRLGLLSGVVKEALLSSYEMACESTPLEGSQLLIEEIPVEVFCPSCNGAKPVSSIQSFCCPECGTPTPTVLRGKELEVVALEITE